MAIACCKAVGSIGVKGVYAGSEMKGFGVRERKSMISWSVVGRCARRSGSCGGGSFRWTGGFGRCRRLCSYEVVYFKPVRTSAHTRDAQEQAILQPSKPSCPEKTLEQKHWIEYSVPAYVYPSEAQKEIQLEGVKYDDEMSCALSVRGS